MLHTNLQKVGMQLQIIDTNLRRKHGLAITPPDFLRKINRGTQAMIAAASRGKQTPRQADPEASRPRGKQTPRQASRLQPQDPQRAAGRAGGYAGEDAAGRRPYCDGGEGVGIKKVLVHFFNDEDLSR